MNKTISINLSGQVFQIDEQAYDNLRNYLESIRRHFSVSDGGQEIIADIEARIAEMFSEKLNDRKQVITLADVADMMQHMGKPEEFETAGIDEEPANQQRTAKRLFRNPDDKLIAGVCSGISAYLGIEDPLWMRLAFVFALIFGFGSPVFIYIILWLIVPEAKTASEKLQMRGENINISNIEKTIKADLKDLKTRLENINTKEGTRKARNFFERTIALLVSIVVLLLRAVVKLTAMLLILIGLLIIFGLMAAIAFPAYTDGVSIPSLYPLFFESKGLVFLAVTGIALLAGIPALGIALAGFRLLLNNRRRIKGVGISLFGLWLVGLGCVVFVAIKTASEFRTSATVRTELPLVQPSGDTLYIESHNEKIPASSAELEFFEEGLFTPADSDFIASGRVKLDIKKSPTADFQLIREVEAQARNHSIASRKAQAVVHKVTQNDSVLIISGLISFPASHHFRGQEVQLTL
ncbi:MAG TPA: PspC domain-containing protein, partial [Chitinophagales bacterium]|nr:PspC domain-containing protein [Chitinophagales bacterium]